MEITIEKVAPKKARTLLEANTQNRLLNKSTVERYAREMKLGTWVDQGDPIRLAKDGTLLDGQHRLAAIVESGLTQKIVVVSGVDTRAMLTMDTGRKRSFSDHLRIHGYIHHASLAAACKFAVLYECPERTPYAGSNDASASEMWDWLTANHDIVDSVFMTRRTSGRLRNCGSFFAYVRHIANDRSDWDVFADQIQNGEGLYEGDPAFALRRWLDNQQVGTSQVKPIVRAAVVIKSWNAFLRGDEVKLLHFKPGGATPEKFPTILTGA